MNLLISHLSISLGKNNLNHMMHVFGWARKAFIWDDWEIDKYIYCYRASYWFVVCWLFSCICFCCYAYFIMFNHHKKKKLLCLLSLKIIHFIWIVHFHLLFSYSYSMILFLYIFVVDLSLQLKVVDLIKVPSFLWCVYLSKSRELHRGKKGF